MNMKDPSGLQFASVPRRLTRRIRQRRQPLQARSQDTAEAIITATLQVLKSVGYAKLTTTRVAERAGVSVGTLYQYFPDKRSLAAALHVRYYRMLVGAVGAALASVSPAAPLPELLRAGLAALLAVKHDNLALTHALRTPQADPEGASFVRESLEGFVEAIRAPVLRAAPALAPTADRELPILVAALEGAISYAAFEHPSWLVEPWFLDSLVRMGTDHVAAAAIRARYSRAA